MSHTHAMDSDCTQVQAFLASHFDRASSHVERIGEGAWFRKDQLASTYRTPDLPIPDVLAIGAAFDGYYAILL